jgi:hypothetical protein
LGQRVGATHPAAAMVGSDGQELQSTPAQRAAPLHLATGACVGF